MMDRLANPKPSDPTMVIKGDLLYHEPTNISVVIKKPRTVATVRAAEGSLRGLLRFAGRHDDRSISR